MTNTFNRSTSLVCSVAAKPDVDNLFDAMGRGPGTMSIGMFNEADNPMMADIAAYGAHTFDDELASIIAGGVVPSGLDLEGHNLTAETAQAAINAVSVYSVPWNDGDSAITNFDALATSLGLKR